MFSQKEENKQNDWVLINNVLQWSCLLSMAFYLAIARNGMMKLSGELDARILRNEQLLEGTEMRVTLFENTERRNSHRDKIMRSDFIQKVLDGMVKRRNRRSINQETKLWRLTSVVDRILNGSAVIPVYISGPPGPKGQPGNTGQSGPTGKPGTRGQRGKAGPRGRTGIKGDPGLTGPMGPKGSTGPSGIKGTKGDRGERGIQGSKGESFAAPKIIVPPRNQTITASRTASFTCGATGNPKPEISLDFKGKKFDGRFKKIGEGMIEISNVKLEDQGQISCLAKSILGQDERTANLMVQVPANAAITTKDLKSEEGYDIKIQCNVKGNPEPQIQWERIGTELPTSVQYKDNKKIIVIQKVKVEDSGTYTCKVENSLSKSRASTNVTIFKRLSFVFEPQNNKYAKCSMDARLSCIYDGGAPPVTVEWLKDGVAVPEKMQLLQGGQMLQMTDIKKQDAGTYKCIVKSFVSDIQNSARLHVLYLPQTCQDVRRAGQSKSGTYDIAPTGDSSQQVRVYCDMNIRPGEGMTVLSHDSEARTRVKGFDGHGQYKRTIRYNIPRSQVKAIITLSSKCEQFIKYQCHGSVLSLDYRWTPAGWWVSADGQKMRNWGGVDSNRKGCACSLNNSCKTGTCNCDANDNVWREDKGLLREKEYLPVSELRFGDTGGGGEEGYHTLGKLKCY